MRGYLTVGPIELSHSLVSALLVIDMSVVAGIPLVHVLVEAVNPVGSSGQVNNLLLGNRVRNKFGDRVADEQIGIFDVAPEIVPDVILGRTLVGHEVASDLDVRPVQNRAIRCESLDHGDEAGHLRVIDLHQLLTCMILTIWNN
jgi:hypothetical protein